MSESMRLANECKADRVDQFYAALDADFVAEVGDDRGVATGANFFK
jgi:hypothetical protein